MDPISPRSPPKRTRAVADDSPRSPKRTRPALHNPDTPRTRARKNAQNDKIGREMRREMDELVLGCALDPTTCDVPMLKHHATAYAARFGKPYAIPPNQIYMLHDEPNPVLRVAQLARARQMADVANDAIHAKLKQVNIQSMGRSVMSQMLGQMQHPGQSLKPYLQCNCNPMSPKRNPACKVKPELCKHHARHLSLNLHKKGGRKSKTQRNKPRNNSMTRRRR